MKYSESFSIYIELQTTAGRRLLQYNAVDYDLLGDDLYVKHGLGKHVKDGQWRTFTRDLEADLHDAQPDVNILLVNGFLIRGSGRVDDIKLLGTIYSPVIIEAESGDLNPPMTVADDAGALGGQYIYVPRDTYRRWGLCRIHFQYSKER